MAEGQTETPPSSVKSSSYRTAERRPKAEMAAITEANRNTVYVMAGNLTGTFLTLANDMSLVLDNDGIRILPVVGKGADQNLKDVLRLKGVDLALTFADTLEAVRASGEFPNLNEQLRYVTVLANSDIHVITRKELTSFAQLAGRKVAADVAGSGTNLSARLVFGRLKMDVQLLDMDFAESLDRLRRGEIDAIYKSAVRPNGALNALTGPAAEGLQLIPIPFHPAIADAYLPAVIPASAYPGLVPEGSGSVATIASPALLVSFNWPEKSDRYRRVAGFVTALFEGLGALQAPNRHPSWKDVNVAAELPGWTRFKAAQQWLDSHRDQTSAEQQFMRFLAQRWVRSSMTEADREALFRDYLAWSKQRSR